MNSEIHTVIPLIQKITCEFKVLHDYLALL